jgi:hypothetical protein
MCHSLQEQFASYGVCVYCAICTQHTLCSSRDSVALGLLLMWPEWRGVQGAGCAACMARMCGFPPASPCVSWLWPGARLGPWMRGCCRVWWGLSNAWLMLRSSSSVLRVWVWRPFVMLRIRMLHYADMCCTVDTIASNKALLVELVCVHCLQGKP